MKRHTKKQIAFIMVFALLLGMLSGYVSAPAGEAAEKEGYGLNNPKEVDGVVTWDCVYFGNYWQEDTNEDGTADKNDEKTPIKWRVLSVNGDDAFLLADKIIDVQRYQSEENEATWETSTMRNWLNGYGGESSKLVGGGYGKKDFSEDNFLNNAFTEAE